MRHWKWLKSFTRVIQVLRSHLLGKNEETRFLLIIDAGGGNPNLFLHASIMM